MKKNKTRMNTVKKDAIQSIVFTHLTALLMAAMTMSFGLAFWPFVGTAAMIVSILILYRTGIASGLKGASLRATVEKSGKDADGAFDMVQMKKGLPGYVIVCYALSVLYLAVYAMTASSQGGEAAALSTPVQITRLFCWIGALPFLPPATFLVGDLTGMSLPIIAVLAVYPLIFPAVYYFAYSRGPALWEARQDAMKKGRRRAKARSRVMKNNKPVI